MTLMTNRSKSPGPNGLSYAFIQNLHLNCIKHILDIFNTVWNNNILSKYWRHRFVITILKLNKNKYITESYRSITLFNTLCKLFEKIKYISPEQNSFRQNRITLNNLLSIKNEIETAKDNKQSLGMISFDIGKGYDTT